MAKKKGITISLAAKCQLLFGLAVLVIIAGALAVPWQRMEQLAKQPNTKAARFAADLVFRRMHAGADFSGAGAATQAAGTQATATQAGGGPATRPGWNEAALTDAFYLPPRVFVVQLAGGGFVQEPGSVPDPFAAGALRMFRDKPQEGETGTVETLRDKGGEKSRVYRYAAAVRLEASCLSCHGEYRAWVPGAVGEVSTTTTAPATGAAPLTAVDTSIVWPVVAVVRVDVPYQTDENQLLLNRIVIVVAGMLGGALAIVVFYLITSRLILQPVRVLKNTAEKVSKGDLNIRSAISTGDEFQQLSETFNGMLAGLKASQDQLQATNRSLDTRVGELAQSNVDLYEANRLKSEFLTNVTHELRTPLNAIIGFADLMADAAQRAGDPKMQRYGENIRTSAKQLLDLINDLLDLAKIEAGKLVLREEKVSVADVCEAMANFMRPLAQKKNISLELSVDPEMPLVMTDPGRFQQILYNFLSNAIKFTPSEGVVTIAAKRELPPSRVSLAELAEKAEGGAAEKGSAMILPSGPPVSGGGGGAKGEGEPLMIRVSITDTGPGISVEDQKVIFEKFRQLDGSVTRQHSGSGLGLAISRELANMLGARIELQSAVGKGATFSIVVPTVNPHRTVEVHAMMENR